jgi:H+/Cl- antiporter ClcA
MFELTANDFVITLAGVVLFLGVISFIVGLFTLAFKITSGDFAKISNQSAKLMSKGLTDDVSDLMGNASSLLESLTQMSKTKAGVGMFLIIVAFVLFIVAYYLVSRII